MPTESGIFKYGKEPKRSIYKSALNRKRGEGRRVYEDEAGGSYKAGHPQRIARPAAPHPDGPVGGERHQGEPMRKLQKAMANPSKNSDVAARMLGRRLKGGIGKYKAKQILARMSGKD